jgi:hypothetical protein
MSCAVSRNRSGRVYQREDTLDVPAPPINATLPLAKFLSEVTRGRLGRSRTEARCGHDMPPDGDSVSSRHAGVRCKVQYSGSPKLTKLISGRRYDLELASVRAGFADPDAARNVERPVAVDR